MFTVCVCVCVCVCVTLNISVSLFFFVSNALDSFNIPLFFSLKLSYLIFVIYHYFLFIKSTYLGLKFHILTLAIFFPLPRPLFTLHNPQILLIFRSLCKVISRDIYSLERSYDEEIKF